MGEPLPLYSRFPFSASIVLLMCEQGRTLEIASAPFFVICFAAVLETKVAAQPPSSTYTGASTEPIVSRQAGYLERFHSRRSRQ